MFASLLFLASCSSSPSSSAAASVACAVPTDSEKMALVDTVEINIEERGVHALEKLIEQFQRDGATLPLAYAKYRRGVQGHYADDHASAIVWYEDALDTYLSCTDADPARVAMLYKNLSNKYYDHQRDYARGYELALAGIEYLKSLPEAARRRIADLHYELYLMAGRNQNQLGDPRLSINYYQRVKNEVHADSVSSYLKSQMANERALALWQLKDLKGALRYSKDAEATILAQPELSYWDTMDMADVYNNRYLILADLQRESAARRTLQKSIALNRYANEKFKLAGNLNNLGVYYKQDGDVEKARPLFLEAQQLYEDEDYDFGIAQTEDNLGDCYRMEGNFSAALDKYNNAIRLFSGTQDRRSATGIVNAKFRPDLYEPLVSKARVLVQLQQQNAGTGEAELWQAYAQVDSLLQAMRFDLGDERSKISIQTKIKPFYEELIALCHERWQTTNDPRWIDRSIAYFERSKNFVLQEAITRGRTLEQLLSPPDYARKTELERTLTNHYQRAQNGRLSDAERARAEQGYREAELALRKFQDKLVRDYPQYGSLQPLGEIPSRKQIQKDLRREDVVLNFFVGNTATYCLSIGSGQLDLVRIPITKMALGHQIQAFRTALEGRTNAMTGSARSQELSFRQHSHDLYELLLARVLGNQSTDRLIVLPDDVLAYLPFEALLTQAVADERAEYYHEYPFLIKTHAVNYQFSLQLWQNEVHDERPTGQGVLAVIPTQNKRHDVLLTEAERISLPALTYNGREVEQLRPLGRVAVLSDGDAGKARFLAEAPKYALIHFAGHGNADPDNAEHTFLAFDLERGAAQNDELLLLRELYTLNIPAELVVLSACQTADGQLSVGEGVLSLSRAMTLAGARSVVSSLWLVNQESKVGLFTTFYEELARGSGRDAALRAAKLRYLNDADSPWSHPYHWAGMVLIGEAGSLSGRVL